MKHLKRYNEELHQRFITDKERFDIDDILLELEDEGYYLIKNYSELEIIITISKKEDGDWKKVSTGMPLTFGTKYTGMFYNLDSITDPLIKEVVSRIYNLFNKDGRVKLTCFTENIIISIV